MKGAHLGLILAGIFAATAASAAPVANLHEIKWFVHIDLISGPMDLAFYEAMLDAGLDDAGVILEGDQGPADTICCSKLEKEEHSPGVTLTTFGTPGDGLDVMGTGEFATLNGLGGSGSRGFLIDSITDCNGGSAIGCGTQPGCDSTPDDDPNLVMVVTIEADNSGVLGAVIAHERGHNACLTHVVSNACELMRAAAGGGCLAASECADFDDARQSTGGVCACHADAPLGDPELDGTVCVDGPTSGQCSGGICGGTPGDASVALFASGGPGAPTGNVTSDLLRHSSVTGGWTDVGAFGSTLRGLAYDPDSDVLYGIQNVAAVDDVLVVVDRLTGATSNPLTVTGHAELTALAFDPGATSGTGDDRLLALATSGGFEELIAIDPSSGTPTSIGGLAFSPAVDAFEGLAYDDINDEIYVSGFTGNTLFRVDTSTCPNFCSLVAVPGVALPRTEPSLAFSRESGNLYMVGGQSAGRSFYDTINATTFATASTIGVDPYTPGGLAAIPVPEPAVDLTQLFGLAALGWLAGRREERANLVS